MFAVIPIGPMHRAGSFATSASGGRMSSRLLCLAPLLFAFTASAAFAAEKEKEKLYLDPINVNVPDIASDKSVRYDYDIVYVRAHRAGDTTHKEFYPEIA